MSSSSSSKSINDVKRTTSSVSSANANPSAAAAAAPALMNSENDIRETYELMRARTGRARFKSHKDIPTMLSLMRLNYFFQQFIHDYHDIVDDESFRLKSSSARSAAAAAGVGRSLSSTMSSAAGAGKAPLFGYTDRFKQLEKTQRRGPVNYAFNTATTARATERRGVSAVLPPRRASIRHFSSTQTPGPGAYMPVHRPHNKAMYIDSSVQRFEDIGSKRTDVGPGSYHVRPPPLATGYVPRFDRIRTRDDAARALASSDANVPGPGAYNPRRIDSAYVPAPKYLTASPRKIVLSLPTTTVTPGVGAYDLSSTASTKAYSFPVSSRRLLAVMQEEPSSHSSKTSSSKPDAAANSNDIVQRNIGVVATLTPQQKIAARKAAKRARLAKSARTLRKAKALESAFIRRSHEWAIVNNVGGDLASTPEARRILVRRWRLVSAHGTFLNQLLNVLRFRRVKIAAQGVRPMSAKIIQRAWRRYFAVVNPRRARLRSVLMNYTFRMAIQARIFKRRRSIRLIRKFFKDTEHLSKSYITSVIRNFRRSVVTIQNFWRSQMWKMEHQMLLWMVQWLKYEEGHSLRVKEAVENNAFASGGAGDAASASTPASPTASTLTRARTSVSHANAAAITDGIATGATPSRNGAARRSVSMNLAENIEIDAESLKERQRQLGEITEEADNDNDSEYNPTQDSAKPILPNEERKSRSQRLGNKLLGATPDSHPVFKAKPPDVPKPTSGTTRPSSSVTNDAAAKPISAVQIKPPDAPIALFGAGGQPSITEPRSASLVERVLEDICDGGQRRFVSNAVKSTILREHLTQARHTFYRRLCRWRMALRNWMRAEESRDSVLDKARRIIAGAPPDKPKTDTDFVAHHPPPTFPLLLRSNDLASLIRLAHIEQAKANARSKRRNRLKTKNYFDA